jgi:dTDP-3-amino-3,4,6-trideoxy-alpha-D-glucose transaminase
VPGETTPAVAANDFVARWEDVRADALAAVDRVGRSGWLVLGEEVSAFEEALADWWGLPYAVGVASGLDAIEIALHCVGIGPGDRVLTTPLTAFATTLAILRAGAEPVWSDVDASGNLDLERADAALAADPAIRAVVPVHLYGHPLDPDALTALAARHSVTIVEDCAQSIGARRDGRPTGDVGRVAATSFYPTKNLGALGDGGAVLTHDEAIAAAARRLRNYGQDRQYHHVDAGLNSRLDELHAAVLRSALLPRLSAWQQRRAEIAECYVEALGDHPALRLIAASGGAPAHHLFPVEVTAGDPERVREQLRADGIMVARHYPVLCPHQPAAEGAGVTLGDLAAAARLAEREVSLPIHPYMDDRAVDAVIAACRRLVD